MYKLLNHKSTDSGNMAAVKHCEITRTQSLM